MTKNLSQWARILATACRDGTATDEEIEKFARKVAVLQLDGIRMDYLERHCVKRAPADAYLRMEFESTKTLREAIDDECHLDS